MDPSAVASRTCTLMVVSHTHWDREWYLPFQLYRLRLAEMMSRLLDLLETDPSYRCFTLDGHTALVEDYLEVHPEDAARIRRLAQGGRLFMGPWYILPDEFLVGGEALVRNLLEGHRIARRFGGSMKVGHLPDQFGHIAQMPQILRGFGIDAAVIWRGVGDPVDESEFWWRAPDGSRVLTLYLRYGYDQAHDLPPDVDGFLLRVARARAQLEPLATTDILLLMNGSDHAFPQPHLPELMAAANQVLSDAHLVHSNLPEVIAAVRRSAAARGVDWQTVAGEFRSGQRTPLLPGVLSARMWIKQRNHAAEQLLTRWAEPFSVWAIAEECRRVTSGPLTPFDWAQDEPDSSEQLNQGRRDAELPERWVRGTLRQAWKYLLQNQPHDSICGCSIDQVHEEMRPRFDWVDQMGSEVTARSLEAIAARIDTSSPVWPEGAVPVVVFNPVGGPRTDTVTVRAAIPAAGGFTVVDNDGEPVPAQVAARHYSDVFSTEVGRAELARRLERLGAQESCAVLDEFGRWLLDRAHVADPTVVLTNVRLSRGPRPESLRVDLEAAASSAHNYRALREALEGLRQAAGCGGTELFHLRVFRTDQQDVEIRFLARAVPGYGYRCFAVAPETTTEAAPSQPPVEVRVIENEFCTVAVDPSDGTLAVTDKERQTTLRGLHQLVDSGDAGDEYNYAPPAQDVLVAGPAAPPRVTLVEQGPARWTLKVELDMSLPLRLTPDRAGRSAEQTPCAVTCFVSLTPGVRRVDLRTEVENTAEDHRLRVLFPTPYRADTSWAESHFGVTARPIAAPKPGSGWLEDPVGTSPQKTFVDICDETAGLMLINRGLPEFEVLPTSEGATMALTLLRGVGWLSRDDLPTRRGYAGPALPTPGAQGLGRWVFEYALAPHAGSWETALTEAHACNAPLQAVAAGVHPGPLPAALSFLEVTPHQVVVSTVKLPEKGGGVVVRLYNPCSRPVRGRVRLYRPARLVQRVDLEERVVGRLAQATAAFEVTLGPAEIMTMRVQFEGGESE